MLLKRYNVSSFKELTVKQRGEILDGLNGLQVRAASGRNSEHDKQEKAQSDANGSEQHNNAFDRGDLSKRQFLEKEALNAEK